MNHKKYFILMVFVLGSITAQSSNECTTPNREPGVCINILNCPALTSILEHRKKVEYFNLIKASFCGYEGRTTKACCPLNDSPIELPPEPAQRPPRPPDQTDGAPSTVLPSPTTCGRVQVNRDRIVGGHEAALGAWPWIAALGYQSPRKDEGDLQWLCGGTLITDRHVITAAHCVMFLQGGRKLVAVRLGDLNLDSSVDDGSTPIDVPVEETIANTRYNAQIMVNDIALLKLKNTVTFSKFIQPICLLRIEEMNKINLARTMPYVVGWGSTHAQDGNFPAETSLMEIQLPIVNNTDCKKTFELQRTKNVIDDRVLCAGFAKGGKDSCRGDSGGPLMWPKKNQYFLMGIVSYGAKVCGTAGIPGVYTRIPSFIDWIENNIRF